MLVKSALTQRGGYNFALKQGRIPRPNKFEPLLTRPWRKFIDEFVRRDDATAYTDPGTSAASNTATGGGARSGLVSGTLNTAVELAAGNSYTGTTRPALGGMALEALRARRKRILRVGTEPR